MRKRNTVIRLVAQKACATPARKDPLAIGQPQFQQGVLQTTGIEGHAAPPDQGFLSRRSHARPPPAFLIAICYWIGVPSH
jgi:hypothetical protein